MNLKNKLYKFKEEVKEIFIYPKMQLDEVDYDAYWKDKRGDKIGGLSNWQKERANFAMEKIKNHSISQESVSICDIGCGDGNILNYIKENTSTFDIHSIGVDVSEFALDKAKEFGVETHLEDITKEEFLKKIPKADYSIMFEILEHIPHSENFLKHVYKNSEKGVLFSFPNTGFIKHRLRLLFGKFPLQWRLHPGEHLRYWTYTDLNWWLKEQGYVSPVVHSYKGIPLLNKFWPSLFAAGFVVFIKK